MKRSYWTITGILAVFTALVLSIALCTTAFAYSCYEPVTAYLEMEGKGTYSLKSTDSMEPEISITINGKGVFELTYNEPGDHQYVLYSKNPNETQKYNIIISVTTDAADQLVVTLTCINPDDGTKPLKISYLKPPRIPQDNKTGDSTDLYRYVKCFAASALLCAVLVYWNKKKDKEEETS